MQAQRTVFISYRRTNMYMARAVYQDLRGHGYDAFLDMERLDSGDFSQGLRGQIAARAHFVLILTPSALERCTSAEDWVRQEITSDKDRDNKGNPIRYTYEVRDLKLDVNDSVFEIPSGYRSTVR